MFFSQHKTNLRLIDSSNYYLYHGKHLRALKLLYKLKEDSSLKNDIKSEYLIYRLLGRAMYDLGEREKACEFYSTGLSLAASIKDSISMADFNTYLAAVNVHALSDLGNKQLYFARKIYQSRNLKDKLLLLYLKLGTHYSFLNIKDSVNFYFNKVLEGVKIKGNDSLLIPVYLNLGVMKENEKDYKGCYDYTQKAIAISKKYNDKKSLSLLLANLAWSFTDTKQYDSSLIYSKRALEEAYKINYIRPLIVAYENLVEVSQLKNDFKGAFLYYKKVVVLRDSFGNINKDLASLKNQLEGSYKDKEFQIKSEAFIKDQKSKEDIFMQKMIILIVVIVLILVAVTATILYNRFKIIQKQKHLIEKQKSEITLQHDEITIQKEILQERNTEIIDSINYAKKIQYTLLAQQEFISASIADHFILFKPKDIVSGDFYWAAKNKDKFYLAVCDSTGHGVPGAFMSLLNIGFLSEAINEKGITKPNEVFNYVRQRLDNSLSKYNQKDGFDGILVCFDLKDKKITYAAANNAPVVINNGILEELDYDKMPVGIGERKEEFRLFEMNLTSESTLILYTDGFADQFGGPKGKKFKYKQMNEKIVMAHNLPLKEQSSELEKVFEHWKGDLEQVDDVCIIGIRI